jgi:septum formation protein
MSNAPLLLASTSIYRAKLLEQLGVPFATFKSEIDETARADERPIETCLRLAQEKASNAARLRGNGELIIGSDQVIDMNGIAISKPGNCQNARDQLLGARGKSLMSYTALALLDTRTGTMLSDVVSTEVKYRNVSDEEIERYLLAEQPYDCAGSVKVETRGIALLERVSSDDPTALIGLPLIRLTDFLRQMGYRF